MSSHNLFISQFFWYFFGYFDTLPCIQLWHASCVNAASYRFLARTFRPVYILFICICIYMYTYMCAYIYIHHTIYFIFSILVKRTKQTDFWIDLSASVWIHFSASALYNSSGTQIVSLLSAKTNPSVGNCRKKYRQPGKKRAHWGCYPWLLRGGGLSKKYHSWKDCPLPNEHNGAPITLTSARLVARGKV